MNRSTAIFIGAPSWRASEWCFRYRNLAFRDTFSISDPLLPSCTRTQLELLAKNAPKTRNFESKNGAAKDISVLKDGNPGSIGYGIDRAFAKEGADLVITGRNEAKLQAAKQELEAEFDIEVLPVVADVTAGEDNEATVQRVVDAAIEKFGHIDALVNNAQASASGVTLAEHTMEQFNLAIYSGLYAAYLYMQKCYPYLKETKGSVVDFASGAGLFGNYGQCSYAAAKEGIRGLTRVAATEWGPDGINVNIVCPLAWTAALENFKDTYPEAYEANVHMPPMGHYGNVEHEIGRVVVQLCSPDFKFMSGETVTLEGGLGLRP